MHCESGLLLLYHLHSKSSLTIITANAMFIFSVHALKDMATLYMGVYKVNLVSYSAFQKSDWYNDNVKAGCRLATRFYQILYSIVR